MQQAAHRIAAGVIPSHPPYLDGPPTAPYSASMVVHTAKSTHSFTLDAETAPALAALAQQWQLSEGDALRRAIWSTCHESTAPETSASSPAERRQALAELRSSLAEQGTDFNAWEREAREIRQGH